MQHQHFHEPNCSCSKCYTRKTLAAAFVVGFDFFIAIGALVGIILCTYCHMALFGSSAQDYCPHSVTRDIMTQVLVVCVFLASSVCLVVGLMFKLAWTMGAHILKDGLFLIVSFILMIVNAVAAARSDTFTLYDGAVLASIAVFAALHVWFIFVMVSVGNYISGSPTHNQWSDRKYSLVNDFEKNESTVCF